MVGHIEGDKYLRKQYLLHMISTKAPVVGSLSDCRILSSLIVLSQDS